MVGLLVFSTTASAHDGVGIAGPPLGFVAVVTLPALAGLLGGLVVLRSRHSVGRAATLRRRELVVGLLLVVLGGTFVFAALATGLTVTVVGGIVGVGVAAVVASRGSTPDADSTGHAHLTLGAVCTHRVFEGVLVGALYSTGAAVGLFGAVVLAGHTALETAAVGGLYAGDGGRRRAPTAVVAVQAGYVLGALVGLGVTLSIPVGVRTITLAVAGGVLVAVGLGETRRSVDVAGRLPGH